MQLCCLYQAIYFAWLQGKLETLSTFCLVSCQNHSALGIQLLFLSYNFLTHLLYMNFSSKVFKLNFYFGIITLLKLHISKIFFPHTNLFDSVILTHFAILMILIFCMLFTSLDVTYNNPWCALS